MSQAVHQEADVANGAAGNNLGGHVSRHISTAAAHGAVPCARANTVEEGGMKKLLNLVEKPRERLRLE